MTKKSFFSICAVAAVVVTAFCAFNVPSALSAGDSAWLTRCDEDETGNAKHCEVYTRLNMQNTDKRVVEFAIGYPANSPGVAKGVVILPLGISLQDDAVFFIDEKPYFNAKVNYCLANGCYALVTLPDQAISKMKKGNEAALKFKAMSGKPFVVKMSLAGFTKALKELNEGK